MKIQRNLTLLAFLSLSGALFAQDNKGWKQFLYRENANFYEICAEVDRYFAQSPATVSKPDPDAEFNWEDEGSEQNQYGAWKWFWSSRINANGTFPDIRSAGRLRNDAPGAPPVELRGNAQNCGWQLISQNTCTGGYNGMGRTSSIAFHPTNPNIYYVAGQNGGVWKTTDGGDTYAPVSEGLPYNAASNILVDYNNPDMLYLSNGDNSGWWAYTTGIYKSTDGGTNWEPTGLSWSLTQSVAVLKMDMNPQNPATLIVAASNGLWRTQNGGASWTKVRDGFYSDVRYRPGDSTTVYAALHDYWGFSQIYKSTNSGDTWTKISTYTFYHNWIRLTVTPADPNVLAAVCDHDGEREFYFSPDNGAGLAKRSDCPESDILMFSPANANTLYCGAVNAYRSDDQGASWTKISHWHGGQPEPEIHADQRNINWQPGTNHVFFCNDGGIYRYEETSQTWTERSNGLLITQFYRIAVSQTDEMFMIGGTQDNGGRKRVAPGEWESTNGGDAMEVAIDYTNPDILYSTYIYGQLYRSTDRWNGDVYRISDNLPGQTANHDLNGEWVAPYQIDPNNPAVLVLGYAEVYRSTTRGNTWTQISANLTGSPDAKLDALAIAPSNSNVIYASNNDRLYKTTNLGGNWTSATVPGSAAITSITIHPQDPNTLYVTRGGYTNGIKVMRSTNGGSTWTNISGSLPNSPVNTLYLDVAADGSYTLFAGNDLGVWYRTSAMSDWASMNQNLPITIVSDLELQRASRKLRAGTYGRGIWEYDLSHLPAKHFSICADIYRANICLPQTYTVTVSANAWQDPGGPVGLSVSGLPAGATAAIGNPELAPGESTAITFDLPAGLPEGVFPVILRAAAGGDTATATVQLTLVSNDFSALALSTPANGATGQSRWPLLRWNGVADANAYDVELATNPSFEAATIFKAYSNIKADTLQWNIGLEEGQIYYWRIRPVNACGPGAWTPPFVFVTAAKICAALEATDLPKPITGNGTPTVESKITVLASGPISEIKVKNFQGSHEFFKDLEAYLIGPSGTQALLFKNKCGSYNGAFKLGFDDGAPQAFGCPPPQNSNAYRPEGLLSAFKGQDAAGVWTLRVKDTELSSGGQLAGFAIEFCSDAAQDPPLIVRNEPLSLAPGNNAGIGASLLQAEDAATPAAGLVFTLMTVPAHGELQLYWAGALHPGDQFTQADIDNSGLRYFNYGTGETADQFLFSVSDGEGGLAAGVFQIAPQALSNPEPGAPIPFALAPNPASETVALALSEPLNADARVKLYNPAGQGLRQWIWPSGTATLALDVREIPPGVYIVAVHQKNGMRVRRLVVQ
jgi:photosystem II stability/assembly factor-like uncharacterized protein/subtilisin-like proprotein convertase family protein